MEPQTDERQRMGDPRVPQLQARIRELEAALRKVLIIYGDERGDGAEGDAISAARACFPAETPAKPVLTGVDMASGPDRTIWYCNECGITDYPCNHAKSQADRGGVGK